MCRHTEVYLGSPRDLVRFLGCHHAGCLDVVDLEPPLPRAQGKARQLEVLAAAAAR